jgi:hypothetical protein
MMFLPLLLIGLVVLAVWLARQRNGMSGEGPSGRSRALEILRERYALVRRRDWVPARGRGCLLLRQLTASPACESSGWHALVMLS